VRAGAGKLAPATRHLFDDFTDRMITGQKEEDVNMVLHTPDQQR